MTYTTNAKASFALMPPGRDHLSHGTAPHQRLIQTPTHIAEAIAMPTVTTAPSVLIRAARGSDGPALARLAALDSARVPAGDLLVAEADGVLVAARSVHTGAAVADPFRPTSDVLALLALRAGALAAPARARRLAGRLGVRPRRVAHRTA
jgi:hypothetical protein